MEIRPVEDADRPWVAGLCSRLFGSEAVAVLGRVHRPNRLPGLVAWDGGLRLGALAYCEEEGGAEVVMLAAEPTGLGAGTALLAEFQALARARHWGRCRAFTSNDNTAALRFYQQRGWDLVALHRGAVQQDRSLKAEIPERGSGGIPLRHLLELELRLPPGTKGAT